MHLDFALQGKLSAVLKFLRNVRYDLKKQRRKVIKNLCVSAYPDVQPWQVRKACLDLPPPDPTETETKIACTEDCLREFYYSYLTMLLDPFEGHEAARRNAKLLKVNTSDNLHCISPIRAISKLPSNSSLYFTGMV
jgi:hypothetical protein